MAVIGGGGVFPQLTITNSMTWTPPMSGNVCIHVVGAGSGGRGGSSYGSGGGAGGYCRYNSLAVTPSNNLTIVVGSGGKGGVGSAWTTVNGYAGGNSTVSWTSPSSVTLTANGGTIPYGGTPGAGGTASGGDVNNTGGGSNQPYGGSGGGSVGIFGTGVAGHGTVGTQNTSPDSGGGGLAMSQFGVIVGGTKMGDNRKDGGDAKEGFGHNGIAGGDLMGGGLNYSADWYAAGGNAGIGGGGGGGNSYNGLGGRGGDGIVLIQYLPW